MNTSAGSGSTQLHTQLERAPQNALGQSSHMPKAVPTRMSYEFHAFHNMKGILESDLWVIVR